MITQPCVRTRNANKLGDTEFDPKWGSFFFSLGALVPAGQLSEVTHTSISLFKDQLEVADQDIIVRASLRDSDMMEAVSSVLKPQQIETDTKFADYYRHKIGLDHVKGRNCNIAIRGAGKTEFEDVGNIILLEKNGVPHSIEIALGISTMLKELAGLDHVLDAHPLICSTAEVWKNVQRQFEDTIITSTALTREGLMPSNKNNRTRLLKKYISANEQLSEILSLSQKDVIEIANEYEQREYGSSGALANVLET
jgi:hypothetical protein